jgi:hypothetical protein
MEVRMFRRTALSLLAVIALAAARAEAVTIRDVIELSKAGLSDQVLLALIEVDRGVFKIDTATVKQLKDAGVSEAVIVALIKSGRTPPPPDPEPASQPSFPAPQPEVIVIDHHDAPSPAPVVVPYPVAVPVYVGVPTRRHPFGDTIMTTINTDVGVVKARVPVPSNCVKAEPVYWGFGGKLRPDSWQQPPTVVCR